MSIDAAIRSLEEVNPDAVRLAESVSFAVMIDRAFLRATRLTLSPPVDAGAEADLWFSALVQSRTADGIVFHPEAADALRQRLKAEQVEELWERTKAAHVWLAPSLQLEERIAYLSVSREPTAGEDLLTCLRSVLAAMVSGERAGLAQWAVRALAMFPSRVQALPEARMLDTGTRLRLGNAIDAQPSETPLPSWMPWLAPASIGTVSLQFELREGELQIQTTTQDLPVKIPKTNPLILELSWRDDSRRQHTRQITFRDQTTVPVGSRELTLRSITGEEFDLHETGRGTSRLREAIVDFSREMERHRVVVGKERELAEIFNELVTNSKIAITGEVGTGKTAFLCELIREAERRGIPTVVHFFRFGDLRMESFEAAERSLSAQIALRFGMDERVLELRLIEVLERLQSQRLLIVIDDIDEARNSDRVRLGGSLQKMFPKLPDGVTAVGSSLYENTDDSPYVYHLDRRTAGFPTVDSVQRLLSDHRFPLATVALQPLPDAILDRSPVPHNVFLRTEGDEFLILDDVTRALAIDALGPEAVAQGHRALVNALAQTRHLERVDLYYLTNAVWHLVQTGDMLAARELATRLDFVTAKIEKLGVRAVISDYRMLEHVSATDVIVSALGDYQSELDESPQDLMSILHTARTVANLPTADRPFAPALMRNVDTSHRRPLRHAGPIRGSKVVYELGDFFGIGSEMLATWSDDGTVMSWPVKGRAQFEPVSTGAAISGFGAQWPYVITADANGFLQLFDVYAPANRVVRVNAHDRAIDGMIFHPDHGLIATWAGDDPIRLWKLQPKGETIEAAGELRGHGSAVTGCSFMQGSSLLLSASRGGTCRLWDTSSKQEIGTAALEGPATGIAYHWDSSARFVMTDTRLLDIVEVQDSSRHMSSHSFNSGHDLPVTGVAVSVDGRFFATWSDDQTIRLRNVPMGGATRHLLSTHRAAITACRFHPKRPWLITADAEGIAMVWDREMGRLVSRFDGHIRAIRTIEINGDSIFTGGDDGIVLEWNVTSGALIRDFSKPRGRIEECVVMPGDDLPVLISDGESEIRTGDFERPMPVNSPTIATSSNEVLVCAGDASTFTYFMRDRSALLPRPDVSDIAVCAIRDRAYFAIATRDSRLFFAGPGLDWHELVDHSPVTLLAFAAHPFLIGTSIDGALSIWDIEHFRLLHRLDAHRSRILALAALENYAVTGSADGTLRIWDLRTGSARTIEAAHDGPITGLWMEGNIVVSASLDRTVRLFDYKGGYPLAVYRGHRDRVTGVVIAMTDEVIYSCSDDRTIRQWDIDTGEQKAVVYGTAPFRCISWRNGKLVAGDDAGNLWTVRTEPSSASVFIFYDGDTALANRLLRDLRSEGISWARPDAASTAIVIASHDLFSNPSVSDDVQTAIRRRIPIIVLLRGVNRVDVTRAFPELRSFASFQENDWADEDRYQGLVRQISNAILEGPM